MKLVYINDQQLLEDAVRALIESHLSWTGSNESFPSRDLGNVGPAMARAWVKAHYAAEEWRDLSEDRQRWVEETEILPLYKQAAKLADRKWEAAMTLLGIEQ